jgi:hypothetical protein
MMPDKTAPQVEVKCHSGHTYAERPQEVLLGSKRYIVAKIIAEGHTPEGKWFQAVTESGQTIRLIYHPAKDHWTVTGLDMEETPRSQKEQASRI